MSTRMTFAQLQHERNERLARKAKADAANAKKKFAMQYPPDMHEVVYYYQNADLSDTPICAIVIGPYPISTGGTVDLLLLRKNVRDLATRENIRHVSDPMNERFPSAAVNNGVWDFSPHGKARRKNDEAFAKAIETIERLSTMLAEQAKPDKPDPKKAEKTDKPSS